jgi:hypothetical protein
MAQNENTLPSLYLDAFFPMTVLSTSKANTSIFQAPKMKTEPRGPTSLTSVSRDFPRTLPSQKVVNPANGRNKGINTMLCEKETRGK